MEGQEASNAIGQLRATGRVASISVLALKVKDSQPLPSSSASFKNGQDGRNAGIKFLPSKTPGTECLTIGRLNIKTGLSPLYICFCIVGMQPREGNGCRAVLKQATFPSMSRRVPEGEGLVHLRRAEP